MGAPSPRVFGVRHLSPGAASQLRLYLDAHRPKAVLVEGPVDFTPLIPSITAAGVVPPIAMLAYTRELPVRTILYPFAIYSPEYQALRWAVENGVEARFIDLPSGHMISLQNRGGTFDGDDADDDEHDEPDGAGRSSGDDVDGAGTAGEAIGEVDGGTATAGDDDIDGLSMPEAFAVEVRTRRRVDAYDALARAAGFDDYETYWEQHFEHDGEPDGYRRSALALGEGLREIEREDPGLDFAENLVRESHMRREIARCREELGVEADEIVVVVGAFHASNLVDEDVLTDAELAALPAEPVELTLMPYNYVRLSSQSGYGAGNRAPAYFEIVWEHLSRGDGLGALSADYLSRLVRLQRESGTPASTAEVIEGVRLAGSLAALRGARQPTLRDLQDAATTLLGNGRRSVVVDSMAKLEIGTRVGRLPDAALQTAIQRDFGARLEQLKLTRFRSPVQARLKLDLRENRGVKSEEAAWLGLHRSFFLHRLAILGIRFGGLRRADGDAGWTEEWDLQWEPEREIELVEAVFLGDTIEQAAAMRIANRLDDCKTIDEAAELVWCACLCGFPMMLLAARTRLHAIATDSADFRAIAAAVRQLGRTLRYGDVRKLELTPLRPLLVDLHAQACIQLEGACHVDEDGARGVAVAMDEVHVTGDEHHALLDERPWLRALSDVAGRDDLDAFLSGLAAALLLERNALDEGTLTTRLAFRLSPGMPADLGARWFEGLASRNRYGLLSRVAVWEHLAAFVRDLPADEFPRALVCLRRAIGGFSVAEKRHVVDNLGTIWAIGRGELSNALATPLTDDEQGALDDLADMDFEDL